MKGLNKTLIVVVVALVCLGIIKDFIIKTVITTMGSKIVGAPITIGNFSLGLLTQKVSIKNFKLYNPPGFPNEPLVDFPEITVKYDLPALVAGKIHLPLLVVNMKEMSVVTNKEGKLNVDSLKIIQEQKKEKSKDKKEEKKPQDINFQIDVMKLNIERVIHKDYSKEGEPVILVYETDLKDKTFKNLKSVPELVMAVMVQGLSSTAIRSAGMYAAATLMGIGFLPAGVAGVLLSKDDMVYEFSQSNDKVFNTILGLIKDIGELKLEDKAKNLIRAKVYGADIIITIEATPKNKRKVTIGARQMMLPKADVAAGIMYQLKERL